MIKQFNGSGAWRQDSAVGRPKSVVWLTPKSGMVGALVAAAERAFAGSHTAALRSLTAAVEVQNRVGLWNAHVSRHGIAVVFKRTYDEFVEDGKTHAKAPTIFDSGGYPRFRHWPTPDGTEQDPMGRGRTYELDPVMRKRDHPAGVPEIVAPPRPLDEVESLVYLGRFGRPPGKGDKMAERQAHAEFARAVAGEKSLATIVHEIAERLDV
jgi:hypothetical protein